jgi:DNA-binding transcriptional regulator YdaS (Cro superfamily)
MDIETYLKREKISQAEFAKRLGVTQGAVWQWMSGDARITAERAIQIETETCGKVKRGHLRPDIFGPAPATERVA